MKKILLSMLCALISMHAYCSEQVERTELPGTPNYFVYKKGSLYAQRTPGGNFIAYEKEKRGERFYLILYPNSKEIQQSLEKGYKDRPGRATKDKPTDAAPKSLLEAFTNAYCYSLKKKKDRF